MTPERLGPFLLYGRLESRAGHVYRARRVVGRGQLSGPVVVEAFPDASPSHAAALVAIAEWGAAVAHPGVARVLEVGRHEGRLYSVTELVEGRDLASVLAACLAAGAPPSVPAALAMGAQLARIGREIHEQGRGALLGLVRPADVVLGFDGRLRVRARGVFERAAPDKPRDPFLAPEVGRGAEPTAAADAWTVARVLRAVLAVDPEGRKTPKVSTLYKDSLGPILVEALARDPAARLPLPALEAQLLDVLLDTDDSPTRLVVELLADLAGGTLPADDELLSADDLAPLATPPFSATDVSYPPPEARGAPGRRIEHAATQVGPPPDAIDGPGPDSSLFGRLLEEAEREMAEVSDEDEPLSSLHADADDSLDLDAIARSSLDEPAVSDDEEGAAGTAVIERPPALPLDDDDDDDDVFRAAEPVTRVARSSSGERLSRELSKEPSDAASRAEEEPPRTTPELPAVALHNAATRRQNEPYDASIGDDGEGVFTATIRPAELLPELRERPAASSSTRVSRSRSRSQSVERGPAPDPDKTAYLDNPMAAFGSREDRPAVARVPELDLDSDEPATERLSEELIHEAVRLAAQGAAASNDVPRTADRVSGWGAPLVSESSPSRPQETALIPVHDVREVLGARGEQEEDLASDEDPPTLDEILPDDPELGLLVIDVPDGAVVFVNGDQRGKGRTSVENIDRFASLVVRIHHRGHLPWTGTVTLKGMRAARIAPELQRR